MILWRNTENYPFFIILIPTPDFPHFNYLLGRNLGSLLYGDVSVMIAPDEAGAEECGISSGALLFAEKFH